MIDILKNLLQFPAIIIFLFGALLFLFGALLVVFAIIGKIILPKIKTSILQRGSRIGLTAFGTILMVFGIIIFILVMTVWNGNNDLTSTAITIPTATATPTATPTPSASATITSPPDGSQVSLTTTVIGTASNIPPGKELWLLIESKGTKGYFPQGGNTGTPSPIVVSSSGIWNIDAYIGQDNDSGRQFVLYIALVDQEGRAAIDHYFASGKSTGSYPPIYPLPDGIQILTHISVIRN